MSIRSVAACLHAIQAQETINIVIIGFGSIKGAARQDGGRFSAFGAAGVRYFGLSAPESLITELGKDVLLPAKDINTHFINIGGNSLRRR